jgi:hypothetical protein
MRNAWEADTVGKVGTFRVARDPESASELVKAELARAAKRADEQTASIKGKRRRPSRTAAR